jgi:hypothetical protein
MKYRFNGKEKRMAFGVYPTVTLAQARALRDEAKKKLAEGIDPSTARKKRNWFAMYNSTTRSRPWRLSGMRRAGRWSEGYA